MLSADHCRPGDKLTWLGMPWRKRCFGSSSTEGMKAIFRVQHGHSPGQTLGIQKCLERPEHSIVERVLRGEPAGTVGFEFVVRRE